MEYVPIDAQNRARVNAFLQEQWFSTDMVVRGRVVDMSRAAGFLALEGGELLGLVTYEHQGEALEVLSLDSLRADCGIGTRLLSLAEEAARRHGCRRVRLVTTNDNIRALRFYQRRGYEMTALYYRSLDVSRKMKPSIPAIGLDGIPLCSEIELMKELP